MIFMNSENSKTNERHKFILNLFQRLDLRSINKHIPLQNLSIYYTWKIQGKATVQKLQTQDNSSYVE